MRRTVRGGTALLAAGVLIVGLGACGGDEDDTDADTDAGSDAGTEAGTEADGGGLAADGTAAAAFCDSVLAVDEASLELDDGVITPEAYDATLQAAQDSAPAGIAGAVTTAVTESRALMEASAEETEGPPPMPSDAFYPAAVEIGGFVTSNCGLETLDVTATDYAFDGVGTVPAGPAVINFTNEGTEFHEIVVMKISEGETRPLEDLLALPEDQVNMLVTDKAFVFAPPGAGNFVTADLDAGRYVALCFVPVGATPEALASGATLDEADGHFMHGMVTEFEVT
jgi:hypothetical protein